MNKQVTAIHMVRNVIRHFFFGLLFFPTLSISQELIDGRFELMNDLPNSYSYYVFGLDGSFEYHGGSDLGDDYYGIGDYLIEGDTLILKYKTLPKTISYHKDNIWENLKDSIDVVFRVKNFKGLQISNVNVYENKNYRKYNLILGENGYGVFKFPKTTVNYELVFSHIDYLEHRVVIRGDVSHELEVFLADKDILGVRLSRFTKKMKINELSASRLELTYKGKKQKWKRSN